LAARGSGIVVVAGAGGFIGSGLVGALVGRGTTVHALVRPGSALGRLEPLAGAVTVHRVDAADPEAVRLCLGGIRPVAVVNAVRSSRSALDPLASVRDNVSAAANLLVFAAESGCSRFVQLGSSTEYEPRPGPIDESTPLRPTAVHGATKAAATLVCRALAAELGVELVVLRPFQVYGPGDEPRHLIPTAIASALDGRELVLAPHGKRDWVFVSDVVDACLLALDAPVGGEELNVGTGRQWSNEEVVSAIGECIGRRIDVRIDERMGRPWDRDDWVADVSKAHELLGWTPRHDLASGLQETIRWERALRQPSAVAAG
jgi:nucleoside-diphosphate-sugar epimerase